MAEGIELGRLTMADNSYVILTKHHVYLHKDSGWRGDAIVIIPREAITSVRIEWRRHSGFLLAGAIVLATAVALQIFSFPLSLPFFAIPGLAVMGLGVMLASWTRSKIIQIMAATAAIEGQPSSYDDAQKFCRLFVAPANQHPLVGENDEKSTAKKQVSQEARWEL